MYLLEVNRWQKIFRENDYEKDLQNVAQYMRDKFIKAF
jgi:uncharacterized iron-regulated protein